ncbi:DUF6132 family protein [Balneolaceae bacterium ANBcel3]|nr:DUF6132 family protein [Balneolaceae bacterium ANBcel3]
MIRSFFYIIAGVILGSVAGFAYWHFVGCTTGSCPITSIWYHATAYGALMGGLAAKILMPEKRSGEAEE